MIKLSATDRYGFQHGRGNDAAHDHFARATLGLLAYRPDMLEALDAAIAAEPDFPAAHALRGLALLTACRRETILAARQCVAAAEAARPETADERALVAALRAGLCGGLTAAADVLDAYLSQRPRLALLVKLTTGLRFTGGDADGMRATTAMVLPAWTPAIPGYSHVLGCHAFGLEEAGEFAAAELLGRSAIEQDPADPWAIHAVAHVFEMTHRPAEGLRFIADLRPHWQTGNPFARHVSWHQALFTLEHGGPAAALALYDQEIRPDRSPDRSEDNRDIANATSLLWRLRQLGVPLGARWAELAEIAHRRRDETTLVFAALHRMLALLAVGDLASARATVMALATAAQSGTCDQAWVAAAVGLPLARALLADGEGLPVCRIAAAMGPIGGSHAQRDVFMRSLLQGCARRGDYATMDRVLAVRRRLKTDDAFARSLLNNIAA